MKITVTSSGGFAGLTQRHAVDTETSPAGPALEAAIADLRFFDAAASVAPPATGADMLRWTITIEGDGRRHSITFTQDGSPTSAPWERLLTSVLAA